MYARISLSLQNRFDSKHTQALYELCVDYRIDAKHYGETAFISIAGFRKSIPAKQFKPAFEKPVERPPAPENKSIKLIFMNLFQYIIIYRYFKLVIFLPILQKYFF